jgi:hypothetical protein
MEVFELTSSRPVGLAGDDGKHDGPGRAPAAPGSGAPPAGRLDALRLEASEWEVVVPGVTPADAASAVEVFLAAPAVEVERLTSKGMRRMDARAAVVTLGVDRRGAEGQDTACATLRMVVRHLTPAVRPDDILTALRQLAGLAPSSPPRVTRLAQGPLGIRADAARTPTAQENEKTTRREAGPAEQAGAAPASAYDQLLRGAEGPETDLRAREPDGRLPGCSRSSHKIEAQTTTALPPTASPAR